MKKFLYVLLIMTHLSVYPTVKTFVNNSKHNFLILIYTDDDQITGLEVIPGEIQDVFLKSSVITKITIQDQTRESKPFGAMQRQVLKKDTWAINEHSVFIVQQDGSIKMYKTSTSRSQALEAIDQAYVKKSQLPTIDFSIHTIKTEQPWMTQSVNYTLNEKKSILKSIGSLFG